MNKPDQQPDTETKDLKVRTMLRAAKQARADGYENTARMFEQAAQKRLVELAFREAQAEVKDDE